MEFINVWESKVNELKYFSAGGALFELGDYKIFKQFDKCYLTTYKNIGIKQLAGFNKDLVIALHNNERPLDSPQCYLFDSAKENIKRGLKLKTKLMTSYIINTQCIYDIRPATILKPNKMKNYTQIHIDERVNMFFNNNDLKLRTLSYIKPILDDIESGENNALGGELLENISELYYFNGWLFYRLKGGTDFNVFVYNTLVTNSDIEVIENLILEETK